MDNSIKTELTPYIEACQVKYNTVEWFKIRSDYYDEYISNEVDDKTIFYEAFFGRGITCNPGELFHYLLGDERFCDFTHVWSLEESAHSEIIKQKYADCDNVIFVEPLSREYFRYQSRAKYLVTNSTFQPYFSKKEGQVLINTWHGIPLKSLGYDIPGGNMAAANTARNFLMSDFLLSPVPYTTENFKTAYKLDGLYPGNIIETGYPRIDATISATKEKLRDELEQFGIELDMSKKLILYAPTWKGDNFSTPDLVLDEYDHFIDTIYANVDREEYQLLFKPHQIVYNAMAKNGIVREDFVPAAVNTNLLLGGADILVSDYSSIFFDFLVTDKPLLFYIPDLPVYEQMRGLYIPSDELPGPKTTDAAQIARWIKDIEHYKDLFDYSLYEKAKERFVKNDDGSVCKRVADAVFFGDRSHCISLKNDKPKLLFHTDVILLNGVSFSMFNLLQNIDTEKYDVTYFAIGEKDIVAPYLEKIPRGVRVLYRCGTYPINVETCARLNYCTEKSIVEADGDDVFPSDFYRTEFRRCFGDIHFDCIIDFSGFNSFYANLYCTQSSSRRLIWMHSVMMSEYNRMRNGKYIFRNHIDADRKLYPFYDKYVSCSHTTMLKNRGDLATPETFDRFDHAKNLIDANRIYDGVAEKRYMELGGERYIYLVNAGDEEILVPAPDKNHINFVTMGRFSESKNHKKLIEAFARFNADNPSSRLYIIGDGPIAKDTRRVVNQLKMKGKVIMTGNCSNPFAIMSDCSCFVLPSTYEGQPMVILEARTLGLPVIVSNFDTVKDSMYDNGQLVIGMETDDIYEAMVKFKNGEVPNEFHFDPAVYNREALDELEACIGM